MQRVYLNEKNKLVVETDNGRVEGDKMTAAIKGDFTIDDINVAKLLNLLENHQFQVKYKIPTSWGDLYDIQYISKYDYNELLKEETEKRERAINNLNERLDEYRKKINSLESKINEHNSHWYNGKIKI